MSGERAFLAVELKDVLDTKRPLAEGQWAAKAADYDRLFDLNGKRGGPLVSDLLAKRAGDKEYVAGARKRLVEAGRTEEELARLANSQVILLDEYAAYEAARDDLMKWCQLPYHQGAPGIAKEENGLTRSVFGLMVPGVVKVYQGKARLDQRLGLLRCVEALRLYAAANKGAWPKDLGDIGVPLPDDPVTGKPFPYEVKDGVAVVRGTPPAGREKEAAFKVRYELTIRK